MLVALSTTAADLGTTGLVTLVVFAAKPLPPEAAPLSGSLALGGASLQTGLALADPLASLDTELARGAAAPVEVYEAPPAGAQSRQAQTAVASLVDHTSTASATACC